MRRDGPSGARAGSGLPRGSGAAGRRRQRLGRRTRLSAGRSRVSPGPGMPQPPERAVLVAGALMGAGDVIAQQLVEQRGLRGHHGPRTMKMMVIGFCFVVSASVRWAPGPSPVLAAHVWWGGTEGCFSRVRPWRPGVSWAVPVPPRAATGRAESPRGGAPCPCALAADAGTPRLRRRVGRGQQPLSVQPGHPCPPLLLVPAPGGVSLGRRVTPHPRVQMCFALLCMARPDPDPAAPVLRGGGCWAQCPALVARAGRALGSAGTAGVPLPRSPAWRVRREALQPPH